MGRVRGAKAALSAALVAGIIVGASALPASAALPHLGGRPLPKEDRARGLVYTGLKVGTGSSICAGAFEVHASMAGRDVLTSCTHGPDAAPTGLDMRAPAAGEAGGGAAPPWGAPICYGDGQSGNRVQAVYAVAGNQPSRFASMIGSIRQWAAYVDWTVQVSAEETGGLRHVRWVDDAGCQISVVEVRLPDGALGSFQSAASALRAAGFDRPDRKYLVWADASVICGQAEEYLDDRGSADNWNNGGHATIARIDTPCWGLSQSTEAHELLHMLGAVQNSAPHSTHFGHCTDEADRLCYADAPGVTTTNVCPPSHEALLDCGHDDYFSTAPTPGSWLATHWNTADSTFLAGATGIGVDRVAGADRYATAAATATAAFPNGADSAVLARGDTWADALAGSTLAGSRSGPVLLTDPLTLTPATATALAALHVKHVDVLGGAGAVSDGIVAALRARGIDVRRLAGHDRYETAQLVAQAASSGGDGSLAVVASGQTFADALAAGPLAWREHIPVLLTGGTLPDATRAALTSLQTRRVLVVGGTAAVPNTVVDALTAMGLKVERVAGDTRQATAVAIADYAVTRLGWAPDEILLANGTAFADALSAAGLAGGASAPILLTDSAVAVGGAAPAWLASHGIRRVRALGGSGALSDGIVRGITG